MRICQPPPGHPKTKTAAANRRNRWAFVILGSAALAWFAVRVLPKPDRAAYPCQRAAAPLAMSFLAYLLSLSGMALFWRQGRAALRDSRRLTALLWLLCALAGGLAALLQTPTESARAAFAPAEPPNSPIGTGRGLFPGRVVWTHDPDATDWDGSTGYWWEDSRTYQRAVDAMLSASLRSLTAEATDAAAWDALFRYHNRAHGKGDVGYRAGEKVFVKINLNSSSIPGTVDINYNRTGQIDFLDSSPQLTRAILRQLVSSAGVRPADITVGDSIRHLSNIHWDRLHAEFPEVCYLDPQGTLGRTKVQRTANPLLYFSQGSASPDPLPVKLAEAAYLINQACLKAHGMGGVTLCGKNNFGSLGRSPTATSYQNLHNSLPSYAPGMGRYRAIVDLMGGRELGGKTLLYVIDGLWAANGASAKPVRWKMAPFGNDWPSSLFLSQDPVAIDSVALDFLRTEWSLVDASEDYLHEAALADNPPSGTFYNPDKDGVRLASQGVHEHWNNSKNRQYSRNLNSGKGIELLPVEPDARRIYLPHIAHGQAGSLAMRTAFLMFNPSAAAVSAVIEMTDDGGAPMRLGLRDTATGTAAGAAFLLNPGETRMLETTGTADLTAGSALVLSDHPLGAAAVFSVFEGSLLLSEAGVGAAPLTSEWIIPVDDASGGDTGLAVFNPDSDTTAKLILRLFDAAGKPASEGLQLELRPKQHLARFVLGPGQLFPPLGGFSGTLRVSASHPLAPLALRQQRAPLAYSTLPAYAISSPAREQVFAQVANGQYADGSFRTTFTFFNFSPAASQVTATFYRDDGGALLPQYAASLAPGAMVRFETDGSGTLVSGAARVVSSQPIGVAATFTTRDRSGQLITAAGVSGMQPAAQLSLPVDLSGDFDTGLALLGPTSGTAELQLRLWDDRGMPAGETLLTLAANRHLARFVSQWFPGRLGLRGSLTITASQPVAAVALRQHSQPYSLTTLPVVPAP